MKEQIQILSLQGQGLACTATSCLPLSSTVVIRYRQLSLHLFHRSYIYYSSVSTEFD